MKKSLIPIILILIPLAFPALSAAAEYETPFTPPPVDAPTVDAEQQLYTATVTLVDMGMNDNDIIVLVLKLPDGHIEVDAADHCAFFDERRNSLSAYDFVRRYKGKTVTVDFMDDDGRHVIEECRAGDN